MSCRENAALDIPEQVLQWKRRHRYNLSKENLTKEHYEMKYEWCLSL